MDRKPMVECPAGRIIGFTETVTIRGVKRKVKKFLGVPYASHHRFKKAERLPRFNTPFEASKFGVACPQPEVPGMFPYEMAEEGCLNLNIYVPDQAADSGSGHAVLAFIHGGGFSYRAGRVFPGDNLSTYGNVIIVTINYRLGFFGFLTSGDEYLPGNLGLYDQHIALQWIHENIGAFGGDVGRVTISGESAGGTSVIFQGLYPKNKGLFQRMLALSPSPTTKMYLTQDPKAQFKFVAKSFGCQSDETEAILAYFQTLDSDFIVQKLKDLIKDVNNQSLLRFSPVVDGDIMKIFPFKLGQADKMAVFDQMEFFKSLDLLCGLNKFEGSLFLGGQEEFRPTRKMFDTQLIPAALTPLFGPGLVFEFILNRIISKYTSPTKPDKPENIRDQYVNLWSDVFFKVGTVEFCRMHADDSPKTSTYIFELSLLPKYHVIPVPFWVKGACHGDEMQYLTFFDKAMLSDLGRSSNDHADWEEDFALEFMTYLTNFIKSGDPNNPEAVPYEWHKFDNDRQRCLIMDRQYSTQEYFCAEQVDFWLKVVPGMVAPKV